MKWFASATFWGSLLIVAGLLFLLQTFNILPGGNILLAVAFVVFSALFLSTYTSNRALHWWALIPGIILLGLAATIASSTIFPRLAGNISGPIFLGGISLSFWAVYLDDQRKWWAIIPGGVLLSLAAVAGIDPVFGSVIDTGGMFFIGIGLTFALVAALPGGAHERKWAYIPALILLIMGVLALAASTDIINYVWPVALILVGLYILWRAFRR